MKSYFKPGSHNVLCDRTGFVIKSTDVIKEWNGKVVRRASYEDRHPQDFIRGIKERPGVRNARPEPALTFGTFTRNDL